MLFVSVLQGFNPKNGVLISVTFHFHIFIYSTCNHFTHSVTVEAATDVRKKREIKMP